ncbi:hypothetical protein [uncultured Shewanella sp.]|uniref:hypothetical protein n=1 Tax=uncultured Shewanella sp. TaxID=173975 RepID=UPI002606DB5A|nr:hypothetical protein [uncultured Shewanella sp.]
MMTMLYGCGEGSDNETLSDVILSSSYIPDSTTSNMTSASADAIADDTDTADTEETSETADTEETSDS